MTLTSRDLGPVEHFPVRRIPFSSISHKDVYSVTGSRSITKVHIGESDMSVTIYRIALLIPFLLPILSCVIEDYLGRRMILRCIGLILFIGVIVLLYVVNLQKAIRPQNRKTLLYDLVILHFVRIPLYVLTWIAVIVIFTITTFRFDGIQ